jgi:mRNA-degrading endonuclease RelE of RelBE toxin-antitoxin system
MVTDDAPLVEIRLTPEFQRKLRTLAKKYRQVQAESTIDVTQIQQIIKGSRTDSGETDG